MRKATLYAFLAMLAGYGAWRFGEPYFNTRPEQDACEFGLVSNARYRELLAEAKRRARSEWEPLTGSSLDVGDQLRSRIDDLSKGLTSPYERIAAMHAAMRASGGWLEGMPPPAGLERPRYRGPEPRSERFQYDVASSYSYYFHSNYFGSNDLIDAYSTAHVLWVTAVDLGRHDHIYKRPIEEDDFIVLAEFANFIERKLRIGDGGATIIGVRKMSCPEMPPDEWVHSYEQWRQKQKDQTP